MTGDVVKKLFFAEEGSTEENHVVGKCAEVLLTEAQE